jgi:hypothetical protein
MSFTLRVFFWADLLSLLVLFVFLFLVLLFCVICVFVCIRYVYYICDVYLCVVLL